MLYSLLIAADSGLIIHSKQYSQSSASPNLLGGLLSALLELSAQATGCPVSYLELGSLSVTIAYDALTHIFTALFHDTSDGRHLMELVANRILAEFITESGATATSRPAAAAAAAALDARMPALLKNVCLPLLEDLQRRRHVTRCALVISKGSEHDAEVVAPVRQPRSLSFLGASRAQHPGVGVTAADAALDRIALIGNLFAVIGAGTDLLDPTTQGCLPFMELAFDEHVLQLHACGSTDVYLAVVLRKPGTRGDGHDEHRAIETAKYVLDAVLDVSRVFGLLEHLRS